MGNDRLRLGIIGIGLYAQGAHVPAIRATDRVDLVAISRRNPEALASARTELGGPAAYEDWRTLLERDDLNAVLISTPPRAHMEPTLAALERGLHVLLEKPMALVPDEAQAMATAAKSAGKVLLVGYNFRFQACWRAARSALEAGIIGRVRQVDLVSSSDFRWLWEEHLPDWFGGIALERKFGIESLAEIWRRDPIEMGGGAFADYGSHLVDLGLWLGGAPATRVVAFGEKAGLPVECFVTSQAQLANGVLLSLTAGYGVALDQPETRQTGPGAKQRLTIAGDQGTMTAEWEWWNGDIWLDHAGHREQLALTDDDTTPVAAFAATILDGTENLCPGEEAAQAVSFMDAAHRSMSEERIVVLD